MKFFGGIRLHFIKKYFLIIASFLVLLITYNDFFEVERDSVHFIFYQNMSHFSMMLFLNPLFMFAMYANRFVTLSFILLFGVTGLKTILEVLIESIANTLTELNFTLIRNLNNKNLFKRYQVETLTTEQRFLQTQQAILPFI